MVNTSNFSIFQRWKIKSEQEKEKKCGEAYYLMKTHDLNTL